MFIPAFFIVGFVSSAVFVPMRTVLQMETPQGKMGRVTAVNEAMTVLAMMGAPFIGAILASQFGLGIPFIVGGALSLLLGFIALLIIPVIKFKEQVSSSEEPELSKAV